MIPVLFVVKIVRSSKSSRTAISRGYSKTNAATFLSIQSPTGKGGRTTRLPPSRGKLPLPNSLCRLFLVAPTIDPSKTFCGTANLQQNRLLIVLATDS